MQANSTINQSGTADLHNAYIESDENGWNSSAAKVDNNHLLVAEGQTIALDYEIHDLLAALNLHLFRPRARYSLRSERRKAGYDLCKHGIDFLGSLLLLILTSPLFLLIALATKITSTGPVFYNHRRLGQGGKLFWCRKFRTMAVDADEQLQQNAELRQQFEVSYKIKYDPRVTRLGAFLRKTSLDELPQLINVLWGEMSLVGPRPIVSPELSKYSIYGKKLLTVKPGISGLWQVCGRSDVDYPERVMLDMHYIDHRCLGLDLQLMLRTPLAVFRGHGAC
jgi:lipopolysaccharide/colanic/teichoic acid biosynthesis glycosyltransferase